MLDIKIINGQMVDCENKRLVEADIGIKDGKITHVNHCPEAVITIDATGLMVSPGFIDIHMHEEDLSLTKGAYFDISEVLLKNGITTAVGGNCGSNRNNFYEFIDFINKQGYPMNFMTYIGHNYLRNLSGNTDIYQKSSQGQIEFIAAEIEKAVEFGALGLSYGLEYCPGIDMEEMVSICKNIIGNSKLLTSVHARSDAKNAIQAIDEIEELATSINIPLQISHISSLCAYGNMKEGLIKIEAMRDKGLDILVDAYPYGAFSCKIGSSVFDEGCFDNWNKSFDSIMLAEDPYKGIYCDKELFYKIRKEHPLMYVVAMVMNEDEIKDALKKDYVFVGSDGGYNSRQGHPRGAGTFTRVLGRYSRDEAIFDLFEAVSKMTIMPAKRLGVHGQKGLIKEGYDADVTIFDYEKVLDMATFHEPQAPPEGIHTVLVNGKLSYQNGKILSYSNGKFIRSRY